MAVTAIALPAVEYSAQWWRQAMVGGVYAHSSHPVTVIPGVVAGFAVQGLAGSAVVGPGTCVVSPVDGVRGSYQVSSDANVSLSLAPADSVYTRLDAVIVRVRDAAFGDPSTGATIEVVTGVPSVAPVAPPVPDGALLVAHLTVPPSGSAAAVDRRLWTSAIGGGLAGTRAQRTGLATAHLRPGQLFTEVSDSPSATPPGSAGQTWRWTGAAWTPTFQTSWRGYIGYVQRDHVWSYNLAIPAGRVVALPVRPAVGPGFDPRSNLACTVTSGYNVQVPHAGRYRVIGSAAGPSSFQGELILQIHLNLGATALEQGNIGASLPGRLLEGQPQYLYQGGGANSSHTMHRVELPSYECQAGDAFTLCAWQNSTATLPLIYENPFISYLDVTRVGD